MADNKSYYVIGGLIGTFEALDTPEADQIARANGVQFAEHFCKIFDGKEIFVKPDLKLSSCNTIEREE